MGQLIILNENKMYLSPLVPSISSRADLDNQIEDTNTEILRIKNEISKIAVATPSGITPSGKSPYDYVSNKITDFFDILDNQYEKLCSLLIAKRALDARGNCKFEEVIPDMYADLRK